MRDLEIEPTVERAVGLMTVTDSKDQHGERSVIARARSGHEEAFAELYNRHQLRAYCTALRILRNRQDAEDAVQRAFQRALVNLHRFREDCSFSTWLTRIAINEALMLLRHRRTREPRFEDSGETDRGDRGVEVADSRSTPEELLWKNERRATLLRAIAKLRETLRVVVFHRELQGLSNRETARLLGLTVSAVKARTFHARRFLRKHLERRFVGAGLLAKPQKQNT